MTPREWTKHAIAEDPASEAYYRHFEWFCLWIAQGREWGATRRKTERQAIARATIATQGATAAFQALTDATCITNGAAEAAFRALTASAQGLGRALEQPLGNATRERL